MKISKSQIMIVGGVAVVVILAGVFVLSRNGSLKSTVPSVEPTEAVIPTIDNSVQVNLAGQNGGKQVALSINNIPNDSKTIEYEISYKAANRESPGVYSVLTLDQNQKSWEKTFDVGTCSSGKCIYDQVEGPMKVRLKFSGSYGDKIFEKDYQI